MNTTTTIQLNRDQYCRGCNLLDQCLTPDSETLDRNDLLAGLPTGEFSAIAPSEGNLCTAALTLSLICRWRLEHLSNIVAHLLQTYPVCILDTSMPACCSEARRDSMDRDPLRSGLASSRLLFFASTFDKSSPQQKQ